VKSPFPGVDPYLESQSLWRDFHAKFINCWHELLLEKLPQRYDARMNEDVYIGRLKEDRVRRLVLPDVAIVGQRRSRRSTDGGSVAVEDDVTLSPVFIPHTVIEERRITNIEIRERSSGKLVAVLELLSPTNKTWGRAKYLCKRRDLRRARVHLVEVDLLLSGKKPPLAASPPPAHCHVFLTRGNRRNECEVYSWNLKDPLPTIPIPLLKPDPDLPSSLRRVFDLAYERGQYPRAIDYSKPLELPLDEATRTWAQSLAADFVAGKIERR
jgi:hypothetical protein